jgi:outer membrane protein OmpA-like peptidoglycan-associated protein
LERTNQRQETAKTEQGRGAQGVSAPPSGRPARAEQLQSRLGNSGFQRLIQARLTVSQPDDPDEQEAERVAERVMRMPASMVNSETVAVRDQPSSRLCRACPSCETAIESHSPRRSKAIPEEVLLQTKTPTPGNTIHRQATLEDVANPLATRVAARTLARSAIPDLKSPSRPTLGIDADGAVSEVVETDLANLAGRGQPLPDPARTDLEPRFGTDFIAVRVHTDPAVHELTHVVQQTGVGSLPRQEEGVATLHRRGDPSLIPTGFACAVGQSTPSLPSEVVLFANRATGLTATQRGEIGAIADGWWAAGVPTPVRVDGYASQPGSDALNWGLSCARAQAVADELTHPSGGRRGIPSGQVQVFAHGETNEFGVEPANRRVLIHAPTPPPRPQCTLPVRLGHARGCAAGTDFTHFDFPSISPSSTARLAAWAASRSIPHPLRSLVTDAECEADMHMELALLGAGAGVAAFRRFRAGTGGIERHGPTSTLGAMALASASFATTIAAVKTAIEAQLTAMAASGTLNPCGLVVTPPPTHFGFGDGIPLKAVIGGTQGETLDATAFRYDPATRTYTMELRFEICDDFGVDEADLYSPGLCAFWVLQHERSATLYAPFVNLLELPVTLNGSF